jgi:hypothetical protein
MFPNNQVIIVRYSNGVKLSGCVERHLNAKYIRLISIAGPHGGFKLITLLNYFNLTKHFGFNSCMTSDYLYYGLKSRNRIVKWQNAERNYQAQEKHVKRTFFASADDTRVFPCNTAFPFLQNSSYHVIANKSHVTIVDAVKEKVL